MKKICKLCGKEFEPINSNQLYCKRPHIINCRICNKEISLNGRENKLKLKMYIDKGYAYCSHKCSCVGVGLDKRLTIDTNTKIAKLKELYTTTSLSCKQISKELNVSYDWVFDRIKRLNLTRPNKLLQDSINNKNKKIANVLKNKYKDVNIKNNMINKCKQTYYKRTGYTHNSKNPDSIKRSKNTKQIRYNNPNYVNIDKMMQTRLDNNNGVWYTKEQIQKCLQSKANNPNYNGLNNFKKIYDTKLQRYNNGYYVNGDKISNTWSNKSNEEKHTIMLRQIKTKINKYGNNNNYEKIKYTTTKHYGVDNIFKSDKFKEYVKQYNLNKYGVEYPIVIFSRNNGRTISNINKLTYSKLKDNNCDCDLEFNLGRYNYDIIIKPNILIEIDPTYTHNSTIGPYMSGKRIKPKDRKYHYNKSKNAVDNGYTCIHIWDWDDIDKILNMFQHKQKIYARHCIVKELDKQTTDKFLNKYHLQNTCNGQTYRYGLYYKQQLIQVMTFGQPRYNKNYEWELLRLCTKPQYYIVGGSEKLFKYFIDIVKPQTIISYCDLSKFKGDVYNRLGFKVLRVSQPRCHWYNSKTKRHITDALLNQRGYSQLHNDESYTKYNKGESNKQLMIDNGYVEVYDCGQAIYVWKNK